MFAISMTLSDFKWTYQKKKYIWNLYNFLKDRSEENLEWINKFLYLYKGKNISIFLQRHFTVENSQIFYFWLSNISTNYQFPNSHVLLIHFWCQPK